MMTRSNRIALSAVIFVFLSVIAIGFVAATINSVAVTDAGFGNGGEFNPDEESAGEGERLTPTVNSDPGQVEDQGQVIDLQICISALSSPLGIFALVAGSIAILYGVYRRFNLASSGLFATFLIPVVMFSYFFTTNCPGSGGGSGSALPTGTDAFSSSQNAVGTAPSVPPTLLVVLFGGVIVAATAMLYSITGEDETFEPVDEDDTVDEPETADFARAAGRAADRIEEANMPVDNVVYRAWLEMTRLLDLENPDTLAPRTFAEEAIAVGLDEDDVYELTELFNEVRYGGKDPANREDRAIEILRNIEQTYQDTRTEQ